MQLRQETGEVAPWAWLGGASLNVTLGFGAFSIFAWNGALWPLIPTIAFGSIAVFCFLAAGRQYYINVGSQRATDRLSILTAVPLLPDAPEAFPPPVVAYVSSEANSPLMKSEYSNSYRRLPAGGKIGYGAVAAFRHKGGRDAFLVAHLRIAGIDVHSVAWVGTTGGKYKLSASETAELLLAIHSDFGYYYVVDVATSEGAHKSVPYGAYAAELELEILGEATKHYVVDLVLAQNRGAMRISLRDA